MTQCVPAARTDKMTVEIDVIADDALDCAVRRAVENGIEAVSSWHPQSPLEAALSESCVNDLPIFERHLAVWLYAGLAISLRNACFCRSGTWAKMRTHSAIQLRRVRNALLL